MLATTCTPSVQVGTTLPGRTNAPMRQRLGGFTCQRELLTLSASANLGLWLLHAAHCSDVMVRETSLRRRSIMFDAWLLPATV